MKILRNTIALGLLTCISVAGCKKTADQQAVDAESSVLNIKGDAGTSTYSGYYTIATFNIRRTSNEQYPINNWSVRRPAVKAIVQKYSWDIFGVQEPLGPQIDNMVADLPAYSRLGTSDHNNYAYQHQDIFYKTAKFTVVASGKFWMAPNGPTTHSCNGTNDFVVWDAQYHACVCNWARFRDKITGAEFYVFNTHFDPAGEVAKEESGKLMLSKVTAIAGSTPCIVMGDMNSNQYAGANLPYQYLNNSTLLNETWEVAGVKEPTSRQTGNWWNLSPPGNYQIDHMFVSSQWDVKRRRVLWDNFDVSGYNDVLPSDHFPVSVEMKLPSPPAPIANGKYKIVARHSGKVLGVEGASGANDALVKQYTYSGADDSDEWHVSQIGTTGHYKIINAKSGKAMCIHGAHTTEGAVVKQYDYSPDDNQNDEWILGSSGTAGYYTIRAVHSALGVNIDNNLTSDGAQAKQWTYCCTSQTNMHFSFVPVP